MVAVFFVYGLAFFCLGLAVLLETRRASELPLVQQLPWLAAFGILHSLVEWSDMLLLSGAAHPADHILEIARTILLPISALCLIRFGIGLIAEKGPWPRWLIFVPVLLLTPAALLAAYALITAATESLVPADIWSRYLLYFPGNLLSAYGFIRQRRDLTGAGLHQARNLMLGAAIALFFNALVAGLIVPEGSYGFAPWLNYETVLAATRVPVQFWRMLSAVAVTIFVIRALGVFETERAQHLARLKQEQAEAQAILLESEETLRREREKAQQLKMQALAEARQSAETWTNSLVDVSRRIANMHGVDDVLLHIAGLAQGLLRADTISIGLLDESGQRLELKVQATPGGAYALDTPVTVDHSHLSAILQSGQVHNFPEEMPFPENSWHCPTVARRIQAEAVTALQFDGRPVGGLWASRFSKEPFSETDLVGLESLADQAVIALQHASMAARLQSLAVLEERARIAREMHDGLAQILGYLGLQVQTLDVLVRRGDQKQVLAELKQTRDNIKLAQADVRENILSLRTTLSGEAGIVPALQEYVTEFGVQTATTARLNNQVQGYLTLSPLAEVQLVRIVQEALANVRKHARAGCIDVTLLVRDGYLRVDIADDGVGFEAPGGGRRFGLQTMRERAESVGGQLSIHSSPNQGTRVELHLPLLAE